MTPQNTCATCDFYRAGNAPGHGSCHLRPSSPEELQSRRVYNEAIQKIARERIVTLLARSLWQRICNTVPWEGK